MQDVGRSEWSGSILSSTLDIGENRDYQNETRRTLHTTPKRSEKEGRTGTFEALAKLDLEGHALYEFRWRPKGQQVDFALWVNRIGRYAAQVKGGNYRWDGGEKWYLRRLTGDGNANRRRLRKPPTGA